MFSRIAEQKILEAQRQGVFDNLSLKGQPLPREDLSGIPEELRMGFKILKNAGVLPEELQLKGQILALEDLLAACHHLDAPPDAETAAEQRRLQRQLALKRLHLDLLLERQRHTPGLQHYAPRLRERLGL